eukprot:TRINITY_DN14838_c0_g3_i1.p1 TRINITY_DN14838_c0_g3~~TRINITY_DN14838_c0_g3_i1.p1  ORF type:complete len:771 (+),score=122.39 TRINITY_DN14838_c0_g3_i1:57-2315(+)
MFQSCPAAIAWLHPVHYVDASRRPSPWRQPRQRVEVRRQDGLENVAERAARGFPISSEPLSEDSVSRRNTLLMPAHHPLVFFSRKQLSLVAASRAGETQTEISLLMADIVHAQIPEGMNRAEDKVMAASYVIAIAPRPRPSQLSLESVAEAEDESGSPDSLAVMLSEPLLDEIWLLCVGNCDANGFRRILFDLGSFGALRWDLPDVYKQTSHHLGTGCCGEVWCGQSKHVVRNDRDEVQMDKLSVPQVALKMIKRDQRAVEATIWTEIGFLARTGGHPNLTTLFGVFCNWEESAAEDTEDEFSDEEQDREQYLQWCIVMDLCAEGDLFDHIDTLGPKKPIEAFKTITDVLSGLNHLHLQQIAHRDVKPENILIANHRAIVADLGIASHVDDAFKMKQAVGSPGYASPELVTGKQYNEKTDIFSTGVVFYFVVSSRLPFTGSHLQSVLAKTARCKIVFKHEVFQSMSSDVLSMITRLLSKKPEDRPSASVAIDALEQLGSKLLAQASTHASGDLRYDGSDTGREDVTDQQQKTESATHSVQQTSGGDAPSGETQAPKQEDAGRANLVEAASGGTDKSPASQSSKVKGQDSHTESSSARQPRPDPPLNDSDFEDESDIRPPQGSPSVETAGDARQVMAPVTPKPKSVFVRWGEHRLVRPFANCQTESAMPEGGPSASSAMGNPQSAEAASSASTAAAKPASTPRNGSAASTSSACDGGSLSHPSDEASKSARLAHAPPPSQPRPSYCRPIFSSR